MHEIEHLAPPKSASWEDVKAWRKQQREVLLKARVQDPNERRLRSAPVLEQLVAELRGAKILGIYWPFRGEIDVRDLAHRHIEAGGIAALPVVVEKNAAVEFWRWRPQVPMARGVKW
jgi:5-formyltetrahydrofolate cyclo-ligase